MFETKAAALYSPGIMQKTDQKWFRNKNWAKNYRIWTLRFHPFRIFKSLPLSTELFGGYFKTVLVTELIC